MENYLLRVVAADAQIKGAAVNAKQIVAEAMNRHDLTPLATATLGRTMMGALLLATGLKRGENTITVRVKGDGPLGGIITTVNGKYQVRGYVQNSQVDLPLTEEGKLDVGGAVGKGFLHVTKDLQLKEPYTGTSELVTGEIGDDFAHYLFYSEQTPAIVGLGVLIDVDYTLLQAGGLYDSSLA